MKLSVSSGTLAFCLLMDHSYVFKTIDPRFQSFSGIHGICEDIRKGKCEVYGHGTKDGKFGLVWCYHDIGNHSVELHLGFERGMDAEEACRLLEAEIIHDHPFAERMGSLIPADNRAVQVLALHLGYKAGVRKSFFGKEYIQYEKDIRGVNVHE